MDKHIDDMSRAELATEVLDRLAKVAYLTPTQKAAHCEAPLGRLRARVLLGRELDKVDVAGRDAVWTRLKAEGLIWWVGSPRMGGWEA